VKRLVAGACAVVALGCGGESLPEAPRLDPSALLADVRYLASDELQGRRAGSAGGAAARSYVLERLRALDLDPAYDGYLRPFRFPRGGGAAEGVNVVARLRGTDPALAGEHVVITAHYDHLGVRDGEVFNGADDNASGVAALLAVAAELRDRPLRRPVLFALFDAEEEGQWGARSFVAEPPVPFEELALAVNLDMLGRDDGGALWASGTRHHPWLRAPLRRAAERAPVELRFGHDDPAQPEDWTLESDHVAFHAAGIPFVYFGVEDHPDYHRPTDDADRIDAAFLAGAAELVLAALREVDAAPLASPSRTS
jgi:Zn-dependent M28 family amino/carboxypeptidase